MEVVQCLIKRAILQFRVCEQKNICLQTINGVNITQHYVPNYPIIQKLFNRKKNSFRNYPVVKNILKKSNICQGSFANSHMVAKIWNNNPNKGCFKSYHHAARLTSIICAQNITSYDFNKGFNKNAHYKMNSGKASTLTRVIIGGALIGSVTYILTNPKTSAGEYKHGLPEYTREQVAQHKTQETRVWVTFKNGVYDVTDYINYHPGGPSMIQMAAGGALEPFFNEYTQHLTNNVYTTLEKYRLGNLKASGYKAKDICYIPPPTGSFANEPKRDPRLIPISETPFNGGCKPSLLVENFYTPTDIFYIRNHLAVPIVEDINDYKLTVEIEGGKSKTFTIDDIKKMPKKTAIITAQCGGLRRQEMTDLMNKDTVGVKWGINGISNATWAGVLLVDVIKAAGYDETNKDLQHLQFTSAFSSGGPYVTGIPIQRVLNPNFNVLLAYEMNGKELTPDHGYPLRVIVPGVIGARWVKTIEKIQVQKEECQSFWHQQLYKYFGPYVTLDNVDYTSLPPVQELPVMSAILSPDQEKAEVSGGKVAVKGFAYSGGGSKIVRVELSNNKGKTWMPATITDSGPDPVPYHFTWILWKCDVPTDGKKCGEIWVKATDSTGNTQPESWQNIYNIRGVACNAYHKIRLTYK